MSKIEKLSLEEPSRYRERFHERLAQLHDGTKINPERLEQEVVVLAERLDMQLENYAQMGLGNDGIHSIFMDKILNAENVGLVVIMWTEVMRMSFEQVKKNGVFSTKNEWFKVKIGAGSKNDEFRKKQLEVEEVLSKQGLVNPVALLRRSLRLFYSAQCMLEYKKIPYRMIMGMPPSKVEFQNKISN